MSDAPFTFASPRDAIRWADSLLNSPQVDSHLGSMIARANVKGTNPRYGADGERVTREIARDFAHTISGCLARVPAPESLLYRRIYGKYNQTVELADQLAHLVWDGPGPRGTRELGKVRSLAMIIIEDERRRRRYGSKARIYNRVIAQELRITLKFFDNHYRAYMNDLRAHIDAWISRAEKDFEMNLVEVGAL